MYYKCLTRAISNIIIKKKKQERKKSHYFYIYAYNNE